MQQLSFTKEMARVERATTELNTREVAKYERSVRVASSFTRPYNQAEINFFLKQ